MSTIESSEVSRWWAAHPMTYGREHGTTDYGDALKTESVDFGSEAFFQNADAQLLEWNRPLHGERPFDKIFPFDRYQKKSVLEIGCGMGAMAGMWARAGANLTAVDLNPVAVEQTRNRFKVFGLNGNILQGDSRELSLEDESYDYVYSWGVLHHSANLSASINELFRLLRSGGEFGVMLYHRQSILHWYHTLYVEGFLHRERHYLDALGLASRYGDGARQEGNPHTWPITKSEANELFAPHSSNLKIDVLGTELDSTLKFLMPGFFFMIPTAFKKSLARRWGWSLWIFGRKD